MAQALPFLVQAALVAVMVGLGASLPDDGLRLLQRRWGLVVRVLVGSCLLVPLAALLLLKLPPSATLSPAARLGIALMALCPSAPLSLHRAGRQGGDRQLAALLQACAALAAIATVPLMADLYRSSFGLGGWDIGPAQVALQVGRSQILPLLVGLALRRWRPRWMAPLQGPLDGLANGLVLAVTAGVLIRTGPQLLPFVGREWLALLTMAVMALVALAIGQLAAARLVQERSTVALVTAMRNSGLALLLAATYAPELPRVKTAILAYLLVTVGLSRLVLRWRQRPQTP